MVRDIAGEAVYLPDDQNLHLSLVLLAEGY
jgi:hypothetical protein